jgi:ABC-type Na+ transport system ATPase subunit NatA|tara:strand:+ start:554 stop:727 length:174 start_codon:yes stop_codon:yes gene_type:complete
MKQSGKDTVLGVVLAALLAVAGVTYIDIQDMRKDVAVIKSQIHIYHPNSSSGNVSMK